MKDQATLYTYSLLNYQKRPIKGPKKIMVILPIININVGQNDQTLLIIMGKMTIIFLEPLEGLF